MSKNYTIEWEGPFNLLQSDNSLWTSKTSKDPGIYVFCWKIDNVFWPHYIGRTENSFEGRISQHLKGFRSGEYYIYDPSSLDRMEVYCPYKPSDGLEKFQLYIPMVEEYIAKLSIFLAPLKDISGYDLETVEAKLKNIIQLNNSDALFDCGEIHRKEILNTLIDTEIKSLGKTLPKGF